MIIDRNAQLQFEVWPQNWHAVCAFLDMGSQWRLIPTLTRVLWQGLDYSALPVVLAALRPTIAEEHRKRLHELLPQLRVLEDRGAAVRNSK